MMSVLKNFVIVPVRRLTTIVSLRNESQKAHVAIARNLYSQDARIVDPDAKMQRDETSEMKSKEFGEPLYPSLALLAGVKETRLGRSHIRVGNVSSAAIQDA